MKVWHVGLPSIILTSAVVLWAQATYPSSRPLVFVNANPAGACTAYDSMQYSVNTISLWSCNLSSFTWQSIPFGGGSLTETVHNNSFSATPVFNLSTGTMQSITLTGDVTSSTVTNFAAGQSLTLNICQDGTGNHAFAFPAVMTSFSIGSTASLCTTALYKSFDGTTFKLAGVPVINQ